MMKNILLIGFMLTCNFIYSQNSIYIKEREYNGYIFNKEHFIFISVENQKERYTPTKENIIQVENLLKDSISYILKSQNRCKPSINKKTLKKYRRQYVGFLTKDNDIIIWVNFIKNKDISDKELSEDVVRVLDGGSNYWSVFVNLTKKELFEMHVNGTS